MLRGQGAYGHILTYNILTILQLPLRQLRTREPTFPASDQGETALGIPLRQEASHGKQRGPPREQRRGLVSSWIMIAFRGAYEAS